MTEAGDSFACFGGTCAVFAGGDGAGEAVAASRSLLLAWHDRFTRFDPASELSRLNADPREAVPVTPLMTRFAAAVAYAAELTGGLVDGTLLGELETAGYRHDLARRPTSRRRSCSPLTAARPTDAARPRSRWTSARSPSGGHPAPGSTAAAWPRACSPMSSP
jgi:thiamine biosynthesis lipoprotein